MPYVTNKGADQPAHPGSLIRALVVHCLDSIIPLVSISKILSLCLSSVAAQASLSLFWSQTSKTGFHGHGSNIYVFPVSQPKVFVLTLIFDGKTDQNQLEKM